MSEPVVDVRDLSCRFGNKQALQRVNLQVPRGCVLGLVGENGAGKTTLVRHLLGLLKARQGQVRVFGQDPVRKPVEVLGRIGYLSEERNLPGWMRVEQLLAYTQSFFPSWDQNFALSLCESFELPLDQSVKSLSRGQLARAGLVVAVAHRPDLLVLDEPSAGLDPVVRRDILAAIIRTVVEEGRTVLFSSHLLGEVQQVADRVAFLHQGQVVMQGAMDEVLTTHARLTLRLDAPVSQLPQLPGCLHHEGEGREWTMICNGRREELERVLSEMRAEILLESRPSLEEIFVARVYGRRQHAP